MPSTVGSNTSAASPTWSGRAVTLEQATGVPSSQASKMGRTSIAVHVSVEAERGEKVLRVTEAEVVYVGVDLSTPERRPKPLLG